MKTLKKCICLILIAAVLTLLAGCSGTQPAAPASSSDISSTHQSSSRIPLNAASSSEISATTVNAISLDFYDVTVPVGASRMPLVTMSPENASDKREIWSSSDPSVATVDGYGHIVGVREGRCVVTVASVAAPSVKAEVNVRVVQVGETLEQMVERISSKATAPTYINGILIVNKTYGLPRDYNPGANSEMLAAFAHMKADAAAQGLNLYDSSDFRSFNTQVSLYTQYCRSSGQAAADTYSARPGFSEHQTGLVIDLNTVDDSFASTAEAAWVAANAHHYGFIVRYPAGKESVTGYQYEPWHIRYLGLQTATAVYNSGKCLEEYLGITSRYAG